MKYMRQFFRYMLIIFAVFLIFCGGEDTAKKEIIRPVRYQQVLTAGSAQTRTFAGISKAGTETSLSFRVSGIISKTHVAVGQKVRKGSLIAEIDDSDARLDFDKTQAAERNAKTQLETARSNLNRVKSLFENNNVSLSEYESARNEYASARTNYETSVNNTNLKRREMGYFQLYSPVNGIVTAKPGKENENIQAGQVVAELSSEGDIRVTVGIPESYISRIQENMPISVRFSSFPDKQYEGSVSEISYAISESSTYPVKVKLKNPTQELRPGMPADVRFDFEAADQRERMIVPSSAVGEDLGGNFVFTLSESGNDLATVSKRPVIVGNITREGFEVLEGLQDGELVVTAGVESITDGITVKLLK